MSFSVPKEDSPISSPSPSLFPQGPSPFSPTVEVEGGSSAHVPGPKVSHADSIRMPDASFYSHPPSSWPPEAVGSTGSNQTSQNGLISTYSSSEYSTDSLELAAVIVDFGRQISQGAIPDSPIGPTATSYGPDLLVTAPLAIKKQVSQVTLTPNPEISTESLHTQPTDTPTDSQRLDDIPNSTVPSAQEVTSLSVTREAQDDVKPSSLSPTVDVEGVSSAPATGLNVTHADATPIPDASSYPHPQSSRPPVATGSVSSKAPSRASTISQYHSAQASPTDSPDTAAGMEKFGTQIPRGAAPDSPIGPIPTSDRPNLVITVPLAIETQTSQTTLIPNSKASTESSLTPLTATPIDSQRPATVSDFDSPFVHVAPLRSMRDARGKGKQPEQPSIGANVTNPARVLGREVVESHADGAGQLPWERPKVNGAAGEKKLGEGSLTVRNPEVDASTQNSASPLATSQNREDPPPYVAVAPEASGHQGVGDLEPHLQAATGLPPTHQPIVHSAPAQPQAPRSANSVPTETTTTNNNNGRPNGNTPPTPQGRVSNSDRDIPPANPATGSSQPSQPSQAPPSMPLPKETTLTNNDQSSTEEPFTLAGCWSAFTDIFCCCFKSKKTMPDP